MGEIKTGKFRFHGKEKLGAFLRSPATCLSFSAAGVLVGLFLPEHAEQFTLLGEIYLGYLKLLSVPFLVSNLIASLAKLLRQGIHGKSLISLTRVSMLAIISAICVAVFTYFATSFAYKVLPVQINMEKLDAQMKDSENSPVKRIRLEEPQKESATEKETFSIGSFIQKNLPTNFYSSLENENILQILICAVFFGLALGSLKTHIAKVTIHGMYSIYQATSKLIGWSIYALPIGMFSLLANTARKLDVNTLGSLSWYLVIYLCLHYFVSAIFFLLWCRISRYSALEMLKMQFRPLIMIIGGANSVIMMPIEIELMHKKQHYNEEHLNLVMPLFYSLCKIAGIVSLIHTVVFIAYIYNVPTSLPLMLVIILLAPLFSINKAIDVSVVALLSMLAIPGELGRLLILAAGLIGARARTMSTVCSFCCLSAWSLTWHKNPEMCNDNQSSKGEKEELC